MGAESLVEDWRTKGKIGVTGATKDNRANAELLLSFLDDVAPSFFAVIVFVTGAVMVGASAEPDMFQNRALLRIIAPLPVIEASHFISSVIGTLMLFVAAGLRQRLASAWIMAVILLGAGAVFSLLSGGQYMRVVASTAIMICLAASHRAFYRQPGLREMNLPPLWIGAVVLVLAAIGWLGLFSFEHVEYNNDLWWTFARDADASRFLRSIVSAVVVTALFLAWRLMRIQKAPRVGARLPEIDEKIAAIIAEGDHVSPDANLAFLEDKHFLFSASGESFIMYGVHGRNWIAMGPPVGRGDEMRELAWLFKSHARHFGGEIVFYGIAEDFLATALDLGLYAMKIGETAIVPLENFSLEGGKRSKFRQARRNLEKAGCTFEILPPEKVAKDLQGLRAVSDDWLAKHQGREKQFTLGWFEPKYITRFPVAVIRKEQTILAFANLWVAPHERALSIDLMRYSYDAPNGVMDGLLIELMLWGAMNGYTSLNLGMAPLAGLERRRHAPIMSRLGALVFERGGRIYGFEGLRQFKEKFQPQWKPLYLAASSRLDAAFALGRIALLTSGGITGMFGRGGPRR